MKHIKSRVAALLLTLAMVLSLAPMAFAADEFPDMPAEEEASYAAVKSAVDNQIMTGENGMLNLEGTILRSTVSKMVVTAFAAKGEADLSGYPDVEDGKWYVEWMAKAAQMGIMSGSYGKMNPSNEVTLAEVAAMLVRALGLEQGTAADLEGVPGADGVATWAIPYLAALVKAGYISDVTGAAEPMTRGEFAEVIYKVSGGNYASEGEITKDVDGNIVITADGVSLKGITVTGDVIIADGVDAGSIVLDGVKIQGRLVVRGGAEASLTNGTTASATVVAKTSGEVTVKADSYSDAGKIDVAGTNSKTAEKVTLDMAEPNVTVNTETTVAIQNAKGGEVTMMVGGASVAVESGTLDKVTVANGASDVKVDVAEGATIEMVSSNEDVTVTGAGTVEEKEGSGKVTDAEGNEVTGSDEPVEVPTATTAPAAEPIPEELQKPAHTHHFGTSATTLDGTRHTFTCEDYKTEEDPDYDPGCGAMQYEAHTWNDAGTACSKCSQGKGGAVSEGEAVKGDEDLCTGAHDWKSDPDHPDTAATCAADGKVYVKCFVCHATRTDTITKLDHNFVQASIVAPTCNTPGNTVYACSRCSFGKTVTGNIPATGEHDWVVNTSTPGTCAVAASTVYECANDCGVEDKTVTGAKDPNNHASITWSTTATTHTQTCGNEDCGWTQTNPHSLVADTGAGKKPAKAATCKDKGYTGDFKCSVTGCTHTVTGEETEKTTDHAVPGDWTIAADGHSKVCANGCGTVVVEKAAHNELGPNGACSVCGYKAPAPCVNAGTHGQLHTGEKCATCDVTGSQGHTWNKGTTCTRTSCGATHTHSFSGGGKGTHGTCGTCTADCDGTVTEGACSNNCGYQAPDPVGND